MYLFTTFVAMHVIYIAGNLPLLIPFFAAIDYTNSHMRGFAKLLLTSFTNFECKNCVLTSCLLYTSDAADE